MKAKAICTLPYDIGPSLDILDLFVLPSTCKIVSFELSLNNKDVKKADYD